VNHSMRLSVAAFDPRAFYCHGFQPVMGENMSNRYRPLDDQIWISQVIPL
jgi:hypothetical protein